MASIQKPWQESMIQWRLFRFLAVGALGTIIDIALFALLRSVFGLPTVTANILAYSVGIVNNYILHRRWTYADRQHQAVLPQAVQFTMVSLFALTINTLLVVLLSTPLTQLLASATLGELSAKIGATAAGVGVNFLANHLWTFRNPTKDNGV